MSCESTEGAMDPRERLDVIEIPLPHLPGSLLSGGGIVMALVGDVSPPSSSGWEAATQQRFTLAEFIEASPRAQFDVVLVAIDHEASLGDCMVMQELAHRTLRPGGTIAQAAPFAMHTPHILTLTHISIPVDGRDLLFTTYRSAA